MILALVALLQQDAVPTVGDTIWLSRTIQAPPGAEVRAAPWPAEEEVALLGAPVVRHEGPLTIIAYPIVAWTPGSHLVRVPGPIVIRRDGSTDSLPDEGRTVVVASVLPDSVPPGKIPVQPQAGFVPERITSPLSLLLALLCAALVYLPVAWWWRRRGPPMPPLKPATSPGTVDLAEWAEAGEHRAVAAVAARTLRDAILERLPGVPQGLVTSRLIRVVTEQRPAWPVDQIATVLRSLEAVQYAEAPGADVVRVAERAGTLARQLSQPRPGGDRTAS
jgi:hypothetical protein